MYIKINICNQLLNRFIIELYMIIPNILRSKDITLPMHAT